MHDRGLDKNPAPTSDAWQPDAGGSSKPVFISYASRDVAVAELACDGLESAGIVCWMAPRDIRPGEIYADAIVQAINACGTLLVVLSGASVVSGHVLREVERACAKSRPLIALRIDTTALPPALEYFLSASQWLDASGQQLSSALPKLIAAVRAHAAAAKRTAANPGAAPINPTPAPIGFMPATAAARTRAPPTVWALIALAGFIALALVYFMFHRLRTTTPSAAVSQQATFSPPAHSVAVLPFLNMSGDPKDEYFSDGLSVELLNSLATIRDLQVAARTSSFSFKGKTADVGEIARKLNVAALLEGSIRKDGQHVRISAELISSRSGFRLWSHSYDRDLKDILALQAEIATAVTNSLQATLLANTTALVELGGTQNPQAFDAYLRGERFVGMPIDADNTKAQLAAYDEAIRRDPGFAKAYMSLALAQIIFAGNSATSSAAREAFEQARASAQKAVALAPELGEAHSVLGFALDAGFQDYSAAALEHERALALSPGNSRVLLIAARFFAELGRQQPAIANAQRAVALDPVNAGAYRILGLVFLYTHRYADAITAYDRALTINPNAVQAAANRGLAQAALGQLAAARQSCGTPPVDWLSHLCLAIVLHRLNRPADARAELAKLQAEAADETDQAYQYAQIYAQWGEHAKAISWLQTALRAKDSGLIQLKVDNLLDPLRQDPRFKAILTQMKFPD